MNTNKKHDDNEVNKRIQIIKNKLKKHYKKIKKQKLSKRIKIIDFIHPYTCLERYKNEQLQWNNNYALSQKNENIEFLPVTGMIIVKKII